MESTLPPPDILDRPTLARLRALQVEGQPSFLGEMVEIYLCHAPGVFENASQAQDAGDSAAYREAVHNLKSSSLTVGVFRLAAVCHQIEDLCESGQTGRAFRLYARLAEEYRLATLALKQEIAPHP